MRCAISGNITIWRARTWDLIGNSVRGGKSSNKQIFENVSCITSLLNSISYTRDVLSSWFPTTRLNTLPRDFDSSEFFKHARQPRPQSTRNRITYDSAFFLWFPSRLSGLSLLESELCENALDYNATSVAMLIHALLDDYIRTRILTCRTFWAVRKASIVARWQITWRKT